MAPTVNVKPATKPAAGATPPAADSNANPPDAEAPAADAEASVEAAASPLNDEQLAEKKRAEHAKAEGPGHLVVVARNARFRCPQTGTNFPEGEKVALKKADMDDKSYNWIKSQIAAGVLTVTQETSDDATVPDLR